MDELKKLPRKATEETFNELHYLVTEDFLHRIKSGEATTQDLKAACDWLKTNDITGVAYEGSPLDKLNKLLPTVDPSLAKTSEYYKKNPKAAAKRRKQQKKYNKTKKGLEIRVNANKLNRKLGTYGNRDGMDAAHYKGSKTKGRKQKPSINRRSRLKINK